MYNVKVIKYPTEVQVRVFGKPVKEECWNCNEWGEICEEVSRKDGKTGCEEDRKVDKERSVRESAKRSLQMVYKLARSNNWEWFVTMTFNPDKVDRYDYNAVTTVFKNWIDHTLRRKCSNVKYLFVPEMHKDGAFHFHGLLSNCDDLGFKDSGHVDASGKTIFNISSFRAGFTTATKIESAERASSYICKYITKELAEHLAGKKRYWASRNLDLPEEIIYEMPNKEKRLLIYELLAHAKWYKQVEGEFQNTMYFETTIDGLRDCLNSFRADRERST